MNDQAKTQVALQTQMRTKKLSSLEADALQYERNQEQRKVSWQYGEGGNERLFSSHLYTYNILHIHQAAEAITKLLDRRDQWTLEDVNSAVTWAKQGSLAGLDLEKVALADLNGPALIRELLDSIDDYQKGEARRRVLEKV